MLLISIFLSATDVLSTMPADDEVLASPATARLHKLCVIAVFGDFETVVETGIRPSVVVTGFLPVWFLLAGVLTTGHRLFPEPYHRACGEEWNS